MGKLVRWVWFCVADCGNPVAEDGGYCSDECREECEG